MGKRIVAKRRMVKRTMGMGRRTIGFYLQEFDVPCHLTHR